MFLNIPVKLEMYIDQIKNQTKHLKNQDRITLLKLGETKNPDAVKLLYVIYNPFPTAVKIDCNSFTKESRLYKMYPTEFSVSPDTAAAFVCFVTSGSEIIFNEEKFLNQMRNSIKTKLIKLDETINHEYNQSNLIKIEPTEVSFDETILLNEFISAKSKTDKLDSNLEFNDKNLQQNENIELKNIEYLQFVPKYDKLINVILEDISLVADDVDFRLKFENLSDDIHFKMDGFRLKMSDYESKIIIDAKSSFTLKSKTSKITNIKITKNKFNLINYEKLQLKITIL